MHAAQGVVVPLDSPYMEAAAQAIEQGFGRPPVFIARGGSIPIVNLFREELGVDTLLLGWGLDDDNAHGPNEKFSLADFHRGIRASAHLWSELGKNRRGRALSRPASMTRHDRRRLNERHDRFHQPATHRTPTMLDRKFIVENVELVKQNCVHRGVAADVDRLVELELLRRDKQREVEDLNRRANEVAKSIGKAADRGDARGAQGRRPPAARTEGPRAGRSRCAGPGDRTPAGRHPQHVASRRRRSVRTIRRTWKSAAAGTPRGRSTSRSDHVELAEKLDLIDFEGGAKIAGHGFYFLRNEAVLLELALQQFATRLLMAEGFTPVITPDLAYTEILQGTGYIPRGPETQIYSIENTNLNLVATAEITLGRAARRRDRSTPNNCPSSCAASATVSAPKPAPPAGPRADSIACTSSPRSRCSRSRCPIRATPCSSTSAISSAGCSTNWGSPIAWSTRPPATWAARPTASSTWKPGCPAAGKPASGAKSPAPPTAPTTRPGA